jgi:hypothetical protein
MVSMGGEPYRKSIGARKYYNGGRSPLTTQAQLTESNLKYNGGRSGSEWSLFYGGAFFQIF